MFLQATARRVIMYGLVAVVLGSALTACGSSKSSSNSSAASSSSSSGKSMSGTVSWWTDQPTEGVEKYIQVFNEEYPNIKVNPTIGQDAAFVSRFAIENKTKKVSEDVVTIGYDGFAKEWDEKGELLHYCAPEGESLSKTFVGKECAYYVNTVLPTGVCYNTQVLEENKVAEPTTFQDLIKPEYKKMIVMQNVLESGGGGWALLINTRGFWTKDGKDAGALAEWESYWKALGKQEAVQASSYTQGLQQITQGNAAIMLPCYPSDVQQLEAKGAPIKWIAPPPVIQVYYSQSIPKEAPDPAAAKAFQNFSLSQKGQEALSSDIGQVPVREGVQYPSVAKAAQGVAPYPALDTPWSANQFACCAKHYTALAEEWFGVS